MVKNPPATQETHGTQVQSPGWEDPLQREMEAHSSILACKISWTEELGRPPSTGHRVSHGCTCLLFISAALGLLELWPGVEVLLCACGTWA